MTLAVIIVVGSIGGCDKAADSPPQTAQVGTMASALLPTKDTFSPLTSAASVG
jgi:hypothetical protein